MYFIRINVWIANINQNRQIYNIYIYRVGKFSQFNHQPNRHAHKQQTKTIVKKNTTALFMPLIHCLHTPTRRRLFYYISVNLNESRSTPDSTPHRCEILVHWLVVNPSSTLTCSSFSRYWIVINKRTRQYLHVCTYNSNHLYMHR